MQKLYGYVLGSPRFILGDSQLEINRRKAVALLSYLMVTRKPHSRDWLAALLWPEHPQTEARANLRRELSRLVQVLGHEFFLIEHERMGFNLVSPHWLDVNQFQTSIAHTQAHCPTREGLCLDCKSTLEDTANLYAGDFMAGFNLSDCPGFDEWQFYERSNSQRGMVWALETLAACYLEQDPHKALPFALRWLSFDNLNEAAHRSIMKIYAGLGDRSAAVRQYLECAKLLKSELGIAPEPETDELFRYISATQKKTRSILTSPPGHKEEVPESHLAPTLQAARLPEYKTPFIGRQNEVERVTTLLDDPNCRLLTLLGPGGVGKTRLAVEAARAISSRFTYGTCFIPLAALSSSQSVLPALIQSLGLSTSGQSEPSVEALVNYLQNKSILLVLDNFEHLVQNSSIVGEIINRTAGVKILVTSRQRLNLQTEWVMEIEGLSFPSTTYEINRLGITVPDTTESLFEGYSAVQLFIAHAARSKAGYELSRSDRLASARIATLVEGVPLALELAAGWAGVLSTEEIAQEIEQNLDILETTSPDVPERQRSMRAVFEQSWVLLTERERQHFAGLAVFRDGFTRQAAQEILGVSLRELADLANKSLIYRKPDGRYELHELLVQFASDKLSAANTDWEKVKGRHCAYYCTLLSHLTASLKGPQQPDTLRQIDAEFANILTAWEWACQNRLFEFLAGAHEAFGVYCLMKGRFGEGIEAWHTAIEELEKDRDESGALLLAALLAWQGIVRDIKGDFDEARQYYLHSLEVSAASGRPALDSWFSQGLALRGLGFLAHCEGAGEQANQFYRESLACFEAAGDQYWSSEILGSLGVNLLIMQNDPAEGMEALQKSLAIRKVHGSPDQLAYSLYYLGLLNTFDWGNAEAAIQYFEESFNISRTLEGLPSRSSAHECSMYIHYLGGNYMEALEDLQSMLMISEELGERRYTTFILGMKTECLNGLGEYQKALETIDQALERLQLYDEKDIQRNMYQWGRGCVLLAVGKPEEARQLFLECERISRQTVARHSLGRDLACLARAELALGESASAWQHALEALDQFLKDRHFHWCLYALGTLALLIAEDGDLERAVEAYACLTASPLARWSKWFQDVYGYRIDELAAGLPLETLQAARERGAAANLWQLGTDLYQQYSHS